MCTASPLSPQLSCPRLHRPTHPFRSLIGRLDDCCGLSMSNRDGGAISAFLILSV